jgi:hypothetical protein
MKFCTSCGTAVKSGASAKPAATAKPAAPAKKATPAKTTAAAKPAAKQAAPAKPVVTDAATDEVISTLGWFGTLIVLVVPIVGIVIYFVWAFGTVGNLNRRNYCRASLIMLAIAIGLSILTAVVFFVFFAGILSFM